MNTKHTRCPVRVLNPDNSPFSDGAKRKALLDAAPELLAALEAVISGWDSPTYGDDADEIDPLVAFASIIAKARGEL